MAGVESYITTWGSTALNITVLILSLAIFGGLTIVLTYLYKKWKLYQQYTCVIWERDSLGNINEWNDKAGVFVDKKTLNKRLFLKKANVGLDPDNIPYIRGPGNKRIIYLRKDGLMNYKYLNLKLGSECTDIKVGEEDVNWAINAYERQKRLFNQNALMQYLPFIALAFVSIIILIIFIYFFKDFAVLKDVAVALKEASIEVARAKSGTTVI